MDILYYSNYCTHSQNIIRSLAKNDLRNKISFICIDKRVRDPKNNQQYIVLENGSKVIMPPNIHSVPALLLIKQNYRLLMGDDIMQHFHPQIKQLNAVATNYNGEPISYSLNSSSGGSNIMSEQYTFYNMTPDELSAKGKGNNRQMYNYVSASDDIKLIDTPPDNYRPDKLSNSVTVETLQQQRLNEIETNKGVGFI
jgi:hypothetical protein